MSIISKHSKNREDPYVSRDSFEKLLGKIKTKGVDKVILFGSPKNRAMEKRRNLSLIIVQETDKTVVERLDEWYGYLRPGRAIDILVYTPGEIEDLQSRDSFVKTAVAEGEVLFDAA